MGMLDPVDYEGKRKSAKTEDPNKGFLNKFGSSSRRASSGAAIKMTPRKKIKKSKPDVLSSFLSVASKIFREKYKKDKEDKEDASKEEKILKERENK